MIKSGLRSITFKLALQQNSKLLCLALIIFLFVPIIGIFFAVAIVLQDSIKDKRTFIFLFLLMALYMGVINATKIPVSDQVQYMNAYMQIPDQSFLESLTNIYGDKSGATYKEMGFGLLNILGYFFSLGNYKLFIIEFTVLLYMLLMISIYKFYHYLNVRPFKEYVIASIFVLCFFNQFFNLTIHLQRQEIASAVMVWVLVDSTIKQKINWFIALVAVSLHTSVALFFPILFLLYFRNKLKIWHIFSLIVLFCFSMGYLSTISSAFSAIFGDGIYGLNRLENAGASDEDKFDTNIMLFFSIPLIFISARELWIYRKYLHNGLNMIFIAYTFLICFSFFNPDNTMQYRYFMMSYTFMALILPLMFLRSKRFTKIYLLFIACFFFLRFYITFEDMVWNYAPVENVLFQNYIGLFQYQSLT